MTFNLLQSPTQGTANAAHQPDTAFELGWDYAHHGLVPPTEHLHPLSPVRQGWEAGRESFGRRTQLAT